MALSEADDSFNADGATGSKTWIRDYFLPSLEKHNLIIIGKVDLDKSNSQPESKEG